MVPLAHASPIDPTWVAGLWDDGDLDDVVLVAISADGVVEAGARAVVHPILTSCRGVPRLDGPGCPSVAPETSQSRAPPEGLLPR